MKQAYRSLKRKGITRLERKKLILTLIGEGVSMAHIAKKMGISRQRVHQLARGYASN